MKRGPKKGYKQSSRHIMLRQRYGPENTRWKYLDVLPGTARRRCYRYVSIVGQCQSCGEKEACDRHHKDGNPFNHDQRNIELLCRKCHCRTHANKICKRGHLISSDNIYDQDGRRECMICRKMRNQKRDRTKTKNLDTSDNVFIARS
jgi:hypothetical protein